jgi:hypothetical protein
MEFTFEMCFTVIELDRCTGWSMRHLQFSLGDATVRQTILRNNITNQ